MENLEPLLAFGGNSRAARSARARLQWRDRYGRFIDMGRGVKFKLRIKGRTSPVSVIGKFVGSTNDPEYGQVYVSGDPNGLPNGFYNVKSSNAQEILASLDPNYLKSRGIDIGQHADGTPISDRSDNEIQDADTIPYSPYPEGWTKQANGSIGTDDGSFYVRDAGKQNGYALYHNGQFVGYYNHDAWDQILSKSNALDDEEERKDAQAPTDHVAEAKSAVAPYDDDNGTAAKMIDDGKSSKDILAHLDKNSPAWNQVQQAARPKQNYITAQQRQAQKDLNEVGSRLARASIAKKHGNDRQLISKDGVGVPTAPNKTNDPNIYGVQLHDGSLHNMNRTEHDIYNARRALKQAQDNKQSQAQIDAAQNKVDQLESDAGIAKSAQTNTPAPASTPAPQAPTVSLAKNVSPNAPLVQNSDNADNPAPYVLDPKPYQPVGQDDDPKRIAQEFRQDNLQSALSQAISSGNSHVRLKYSNGTNASVSAEAVRDAIQHQGSNTNVDTDSDVLITTDAEFDDLPFGSQIEYNGQNWTLNKNGNWELDSNPLLKANNVMFHSRKYNRKVVLKKRGDGLASVNAPKAQPQRKAASQLQPGDEVGGGTIVSVTQGLRTPKGKVDVVYTTPAGVRRTGQWWANTQIPLVNRPKPTPQAPTATPNAPTPPSTPSAPQAKGNVSLSDLEARAAREGGTVLYHGGLPEGTTLDGIDLARNGSQQNKRGRSYGGFYLTDASSKDWSEKYAKTRNGMLHGFLIGPNTRIDDRGDRNIDRLDQADRDATVKNFDVIKGKDTLGRTQYLLLNKDAVEGVGEENLNEPNTDSDSDNTPNAQAPQPAAPTPAQAAPTTTQTPAPLYGNNVPAGNGPLAYANHLMNTRQHPQNDPQFAAARDNILNGEGTRGDVNVIVKALGNNQAQIQSPDQIKQDIQGVPDTDTKPSVPDTKPTPTPAPTPAATPSNNAPVSNLEDDDEDVYDPNLVLDAIKRKYGNGTELANGDFLINSRTVTGPKGAQKRYDTVVTRTSNEYFYVYMRETDLTTGKARSQRVGPMVHSAKALNNRIKAANNILNANRTPDKWFNSKRRRPNIKDDELNPATGEFEHVKEQPILDSTIKAIHKAVNDDQISEDLIRDVFDTISRFGTSDATLGVIRTQHNLTRNKLNDLIDNINAKVSEQDALSKFQTWVSADGITPLAEGDIIRHKSGRIGTIQRRIVDHNTKGYEYSDYLFVQFHNAQGVPSGKYINMTSRNLSLISTADGTDGSERVGPNAKQLPQPTLSTRAQNRKNAIQVALLAHRQRVGQTTPNTQATVTHTPNGNSVNVNGTPTQTNLTRHHVTAGDTSTVKPAHTVQNGDVVRVFDANTDTNRLGQVVDVKSSDGNTQITSVVPDDDDPNVATVNTTNIPTGSDGSDTFSPNVMVYSLTPDPEDNPSSPASNTDIDRLQDAYRAADVTQMDTALENQVSLTLLRHQLSGQAHHNTKQEINDLIAKVQASPQRNSQGGSKSGNLSDTIAIAQSVVDDNDTTDLQNAIDDAKTASDRVNTPQGRVQAIIAETASPNDLSDYAKISGPQGSNPGGIYQNFVNGSDKIYLKEQSDQAHADNEVLASALYRATGMDAITVLHGTHPSINTPITYSPIVPLDKQKTLNSQMRDPAFAAKVHKAFAVDAWLANWDSTLNDNIGVDMNGDPIHVDVGGAIQFRAQGGRRNNFGDQVDELQTLRDPRTNPQAASVYGSMSQADQVESAKQLLNISDSDIDTLVTATTKNSLSPQDQQALAQTLKNRRANILKAYGISDTQAPAPGAATNAAPAAPAQAVPTPTNAPNTNLPALNVPTQQDSRGVHYPTRALTQSERAALRQGTARPPALPFKLANTDKGEVHYYDSTGTRRWGQYGAAGTMLRRKRTDGSYEYLLAQRSSNLSTEPNKWSVPSGAHDSLQDAQTPGLTASRELQEELGIDPNTVTHAGEYTSQPAPDWKFDYSFYDVAPGQYDTPPKVDPSEIQATRWVTQDEMQQMLDDGELHSSITDAIHADLHKTSAALPDTQSPAPTSSTTNSVAITDPNALDSASAGQQISLHIPGSNDIYVYEKQPNGDWYTVQTTDPGVTLTTNDRTQLLKQRITSGRYNAHTGNAITTPATTTPTSTGTNKYNGQALTDDSILDDADAGQELSYVGTRYTSVYTKQQNGDWILTAVSGNTPVGAGQTDVTSSLRNALNKPAQLNGQWVGGNAITATPVSAPSAPTPAPTVAPQVQAPTPTPGNFTPVADGTAVDSNWIVNAPSGQSANFVNPITKQPVQLSKLNADSWTNGSRVFSNQALVNLNSGRSSILAGALPKAPEINPEDGKPVTSAWADSAPVGANAHFTSSTGDTYTITKRADGAWDVDNPVRGYPATRKASSISAMAANGKVFFGKRPDPNIPVPPAPASQAQVGLDNLLATADPNNRLSANIRFSTKSDTELDAIYDEVHNLTRSRRPLTDQEIDGFLEKYQTKSLDTYEDFFDNIDEIEARLQELQDIGAKDPKQSHANYLLAAISEFKGFNGLPTVVSDPNALQGQKIFRGLGDAPGYSADQMFDHYRTGGTHYAGAGLHGDGTYFASDAGTAKSYATNYGRGAVISGSMNTADMNIMKTSDSSGLFRKEKAEFESRLKQYLQSKGLTPGTSAYNTVYARFHNVFSHKSRAWGQHGDYDLGTLMTMKGYDAIEVPQWGVSYYVILNRGKTTVLNTQKRV